jgi:hypothetical protein
VAEEFSGPQKVSSQKSAVRNQQSEISSQKSAVRNQQSTVISEHLTNIFQSCV